MSKGVVLLCAGGTGGHLFPAEALAHELVSRGWSVHLATDERAERFADSFPSEETHIIRSATFSGKNPITLVKAIWTLFSGYRQSQKLLEKLQPDVVVGFGGYPTVPPLYAATRVGLSTIVHEQNAVLGRANKMLSDIVNIVAIGFEQANGEPLEKMVQTGNPVRPMVLKVCDKAYPVRKATGKFNLVVFGGSQGARFFSEVMPAALELLEPKERKLLNIVQQARPEDEDRLKDAYDELGVKAKISPFFSNMPEEISKAHLVISRAGASTVTELSVIGRPAILIPYPGSLDGDQAWNANAMEKTGGAEVIAQADLSPEMLAEKLKTAIADPKKLALTAKKAKKTGNPDAMVKLADCVEQLADED